jgi:hypothetical protein
MIHDDEPLDDQMRVIQKVIRGIAGANKEGHLFKEFKELFPLMDPWGLSAIPDCRIMPYVQARIQEFYVKTALSKMWPSECDQVKRRTFSTIQRWKEFCQGQSGGRRSVPYDIAGTEWPTLMIPCPLLDDDSKCTIGWRRPSGCLGENPHFLSICQQIDAKILKKEGRLCVPMIDLLASCCEDPYGSRVPILPMR